MYIVLGTKHVLHHRGYELCLHVCFHCAAGAIQSALEAEQQEVDGGQAGEREKGLYNRYRFDSVGHTYVIMSRMTSRQ